MRAKINFFKFINKSILRDKSMLLALLSLGMIQSHALEIDLTKGSPGSNVTTVGGTWAGGWKTTSTSGQRLVLDLGKKVAEGSVTIEMTLSGTPHQGDKINHFGIYELSTLEHYNSGDKAYMRVGESKYQFSRLKAENGPFVRGKTPEPSVGATSDWKTDGKTLNTLKISWGTENNVSFTYNGKSTTLSKKITNIQYIFVGCDKNYNRSLNNALYKKITIDADVAPTSIFDNSNGLNSEKTGLRARRQQQNLFVSLPWDGQFSVYDFSGVRLTQRNATAGAQYVIPSLNHLPLVVKASSTQGNSEMVTVR